MPLLHTRSFGSLATLLDQQLQHPSPLEASSSHRPSTPDNLHFKPLPLTPQPSLGHASLSAEGGNEEEDEDDFDDFGYWPLPLPLAMGFAHHDMLFPAF